ncbi:MAG TPA: GNAT family N-acetyltransferase [Pyrinomonadaceae bacterium]|nr:GNAT family N-acetyltransferase [Pyrinomonadaceae bacterium]
MPSPITPEIKLLSECSLADALLAWNEGFKGYFVDMTMSLDDYVSRLHYLFVSPELSLIAFHAGRPVGFLLNGIRVNNGKTVAWNGGTGVSPDLRGAGIGKALVQAALELYRKKEVEVATLEAVSTNERAINLYKSLGYEVVDRLIFLQRDGEVDFPKATQGYSVRASTPHEVGVLDFYDESTPWQTQWQTLTRNNGEALIVSASDGVEVGYALYRKQLDAQGSLIGIAMHQCRVRAGLGVDEAEAVAICALRQVYSPLEVDCHRTTNNFSSSQARILGILESAGFTTFIEQAHMSIKL